MELAEAGEDSRALRKIACKLIAMADGGDLHSIREIADWGYRSWSEIFSGV
jgi:hypothetical protein